jgi:NodT family efflux transporter outer membrane factor (OMF) lipoprotein
MRILIVIAIALASSACVVGPNYVKPSATTPPAFKEALPVAFKEAPGWSRGTPLDDMHRGKWWEIFNDAELNSLEEQIDVNNQTLASAEATYRAEQAAIRVARSGYYPTLGGNLSLTGTGFSGNSGEFASGQAGSFATVAVPSATASWTPDLFGSIRRSVESAVDTAQASAGDLETTRLLLQSEVASDYYTLRGLDAQKKLLDDTVVAYAKALDLTVNRYKQGVASQVDVAQAQTQLSQTQAQATDTLVQRQQSEHAIAILLGKAPSELTIPAVPLNAVPPSIPGVIPSELLQRRPDVAANERRVAAANAQIGVAIAAYYPTLSLSAGGGLESNSLLSLFTWPSRFWSLGPSFSELFYDAGRRRGITEQAQANYDNAVANYRLTVLTAFQNVEDNLTALRVLEEEAVQQAEAVTYADKSLDLANAQYSGGITTYLQVISAQEIALSNEVTQVQLQTRRMTAAVSLIQALGGGWDVSELPTPKEVTPQKVQKASSATP